MNVKIPTNEQSFILAIDVEAKEKTHIKILGECAYHSNTKYFDIEEDDFIGKKTFKIPIPLSPKVLELTVHSLKGSDILVSNIKAEPININLNKLPSDTLLYLQFCCELVKVCGYLPPTVVFSKNDKYAVKLSKEIKDRKGNIIDSPARVGMESFVIELSKNHIDKLSIPQRLFILFHEFGHYYLQTDSEELADDFALNCYQKLKLPPIEVIYSFTRIFRFENQENPLIEARAKRLIGRLIQYKNNL